MSIFNSDLKNTFNKASRKFEDVFYISDLTTNTEKLCVAFENYMNSNISDLNKTKAVINMVYVINQLGKGSVTKENICNEETLKEDTKAINKIKDIIIKNASANILPSETFINSATQNAVRNTVLACSKSLNVFFRSGSFYTTSERKRRFKTITGDAENTKIGALKQSAKEINDKRNKLKR